MFVQDLLQNSAARTPNKIASVFQERQLTYQEIDAQANRLAQALLDHGVQRGDRVAIHLPNSVEAAMTIFAILKKAGLTGAWTPHPRRGPSPGGDAGEPDNGRFHAGAAGVARAVEALL